MPFPIPCHSCTRHSTAMPFKYWQHLLCVLICNCTHCRCLVGLVGMVSTPGLTCCIPCCTVWPKGVKTACRERVHLNTGCCDRCSGYSHILCTRLDISVPTPPAKRRLCVCLHEIVTPLKSKLRVELLAKQERVLQEISKYQNLMLGANFLCLEPLTVIEELWDKAALSGPRKTWITCSVYVQNFTHVFFDTVWKFVSCAPPPM